MSKTKAKAKVHDIRLSREQVAQLGALEREMAATQERRNLYLSAILNGAGLTGGVKLQGLNTETCVLTVIEDGKKNGKK